MNYNSLALVYDKLMEDIDYQAWSDYLEILIHKGEAPGTTVIDLGCGTGSISLGLAQKGYQVTGIDYSEEMLTQAEQKLRANLVEVPLYLQDIRELILDKPVDIAVSTFDTLNYVLDPQDLEKVFQGVYHALTDGGLLIFDLNTPFKLKEILGNNVHTFNSEEISYIWDNDYNLDEDICSMDLTFFSLDEKTGLYQRFDEQHQQRAYETSEVVKALEKSGFKVLAIYGELSLEKPQEKDHKVFFMAKKVTP